MKILYPEIGVCGLSCKLCPSYNTQAASRCEGCKTPSRMAVGCPFITCAIKKKRLEFCWECAENASCSKWDKHRDAGKTRDSFKCYQKLEADIEYIKIQGVAKFEETQKIRWLLLRHMLANYNDGRSKSYYCIAATVLEVEELKSLLSKADSQSRNLKLKDKAKILHEMLDSIAKQRGYLLKLRK